MDSQNFAFPGASFTPPDTGQYRFDFLSDCVSLPATFVASQDYSDKLIVMFNGAVSRSSDKDPRNVFQRRTWSDELPANVLYLADPTLSNENNIQIGWGQGLGHNSPLNAMVRCSAFIRDYLQLANRDILFYGSSAGGFQATYVHAFFRESTFLVNNAQFDWTKYYKSFVQEIADYSHGGRTVADLVRSEDATTNVLDVFLQENSDINGTYMVNLTSRIDYRTQLPAVNEFLRKRTTASDNVSTKLSIEVYADNKLGHMPLPKEQTIAAIKKSLYSMNSGNNNGI